MALKKVPYTFVIENVEQPAIRVILMFGMRYMLSLYERWIKKKRERKMRKKRNEMKRECEKKRETEKQR